MFVSTWIGSVLQNPFSVNIFWSNSKVDCFGFYLACLSNTSVISLNSDLHKIWTIIMTHKLRTYWDQNLNCCQMEEMGSCNSLWLLGSLLHVFKFQLVSTKVAGYCCNDHNLWCVSKSKTNTKQYSVGQSKALD